MAILADRGDSAMIRDLLENLGQFRGAVVRHFHKRVAGVGAGLADRDLLDAKCAAQAGDQVQDLGQDEAINNMSADLDVLDDRGREGSACFHVHSDPQSSGYMPRSRRSRWKSGPDVSRPPT